MNEIKQRLKEADDQGRVVETLEHEIDQLEDRGDQARQLFELGQAYEELLLRKDRAMAAYQKAFKLHPQDVRSLVRARQIYCEMGNLKMAAKLLAFQLKIAQDARERAMLLTDLARAQIDLCQVDQARAALQQAESLQPSNPQIAALLPCVSYDKTDWAGSVTALVDEAAEADLGSESASKLVNASRIARVEGADEEHREALLRKALDFDANHAEATFLLEELLAEQNRTAEILELHELRVKSSGSDQLLSLYCDLASQWAIRFVDLANTAHFYDRALRSFYGNENGVSEELFPGHLAAFGLLREVRGQAGEWIELLQLADAGLGLSLGPIELRGLLRQALEIAWQELGDLERAAEYARRLGDVDAGDALFEAFAEQHGALLEQARADRGEEVDSTKVVDPRQMERMAGISTIKEDAEAAQGNEDSSVEADDSPQEADQVEASDAQDELEQAADALSDDAYESDDEYSGEDDAYAADHQDDDATSAAERNRPPSAAVMAAVDGTAIDEDVDAATAALFEEARAAEAKSAERGIDAWRKVAQRARSLRTPWRELARLYAQVQRWPALVDALKQEAETVDDVAHQKELLFKAAAVAREHMHDGAVLTLLTQIHRTDQVDVRVLDELILQYEKMNRWSDLISTLRKKAEATPDAAEQVAIWERIAAIYVDRFSNQAEAIKAYERIVEIDPTHDQAVGQLKEMYERRRDWDKLIELYNREIDLIDDEQLRAERYLEVARLASTKLKRPQISMELWSKVIDFAPDNVEALGQLEMLYERAKDWNGLADVCRRQVDLLDDDTRKGQLLQKLGILFSDKIKDDDRATEAWRLLLEIDPEHRRAQDALKKLYVAAGAYDELESFYGEQGRWDELIRVLERQVESESPDERAPIYFKIADLWQEKLGKPERAVRAFEKVLALDEDNLQAAEALIPLYEGGRDVSKYTSVLEIQLKHTEDEDLRFERTRALAQMYEERLRDKEGALRWYLQSFAVRPDDEDLRQQVERLGEECGRWPDVIQAYTTALESLDATSTMLPLLATIARVQEEELGNAEGALETNQRILEIEPQEPAAIDALERLYTRTQQWDELRGVLERKIELTASDDDKKKIYLRIAYLYEEELGDAERAIDAYQTILDLGDDDAEALRALTSIYERQQRWSELGDMLMRQLGQLGPDDNVLLIETKQRLGRLREEQLGDIGGAIECYRDILEIDSANHAARDALEARLGDTDHQVEVCRILEPIYAEVGEWSKLIDVHEIQLQNQEDPAAAVELLLRIGSLWVEKVGDGGRAFDAYSRCFRADPTNTVAREELERLAAIQERWEDLAGLYEHATEQALDGALGHELLVKLAQVVDERLEQPERAISFYQKARELEPDDRSTLDALERLYTHGERWSELIEVYRSKADLSTDPDKRTQLLGRMAMIWEEMIGNLEEATSCYNEILGNDDGSLEALRALDRLYQSQQAWPELAENIARQLTLTEDESTRTGLLLRLAQIRMEALEDTAGAVDTYRQVLEIDRNSEQAVNALQRLLGDEDHELAVAQLLEPYYRNTNDWTRLVAAYEIMVKHSYDQPRKLDLLHQIGELYEVAGDDARGAFEVYGRALKEDPANEETLGRIWRLARTLGAWTELIAHLRELIPDVVDGQLVSRLHTRIAEIYEEQLADLDQAAQAYQQILGGDPQNIEAINALEQIYARGESYTDLVGVLRQKAEIVTDPDERKQLLFRAAQLYEDVLEQQGEAIATYQQVLDIDDSDAAAIESLQRLYVKLERWDDLKDIYARKVELARDPDVKRQILYALGGLYEQQLGDLERAVETFQAALDLDAEDQVAIRALDRLYQQAERWYDLLQILERRVEMEGNSLDGIELRFRIGRLWQTELGDLTRAVETYREVLGIDPGHQATIEALDGIVQGKEEPVLAAQVLEPVFEQALEWERLVALQEVMIANAEDPFRKAELLHRVAGLYETRVENPQRAFEAYGRVLRENISDERAIAHLERLASELNGGWQQLAQLLEAEYEKSLDPLVRVDVGLRLARIYEDELEQGERAIERYRGVLESDEENRTAILSLDRRLTAAERWSELPDVLRREIHLAQTAEEIIDLQFRLGQLYQEQLADTASAVECYREILASTPEHTPSTTALELLFEDGQQQAEIAEILEPLYRRSERWENLVNIMQVQLEASDGDSHDKVQSIQRIAEICEQRLGDHSRAFRWWAQALPLDPSAEVITEELERLARINDGWEELAATYGNAAEQFSDSDKQRVLKMQARVYDEELRDRQSAEEAYLRVLQLDEADVDAICALDRIYDQGAMYAELAEILRRRIGVTYEAEPLVELLLRLGTVYETALEDVDQAIAVYCSVLEHDSRNSRALEALEGLYFRTEAWAELHDVYEKMVDIAPGDQGVADCYARMAKISSDALEDAHRAQELWNRVLDLRGEDPVALWALADLYEAAEDWRELVEVLQRQVSITEETSARIRLFERLGRIWGDHLGRERNALEAWQNVLDLDGGNGRALAAMAQIYRNTQAWEELAETLDRLIDLGMTGDTSEEELKGLYAQLGELHGEILLRPDRAIDAWRRVLDMQPDEFRALSALEQLLTQEARWEECIQVLERKADVLQSPEERVDVLMQAANIWQERIGEAEPASRMYERVLEIERGNHVAYEALEQIYREGWHWEKLIELLLSRIDGASDTHEAVELLQQTAKVYEEHLNQAEQAFVVLQAAFRQDYTNDRTARELERLASTTGKWNELLNDYSAVVQTITDPDVKVDLLVKMSRWYGNELNHLDYAIQSAQQALQIDPDHVQALEALSGFYRKTGRWEELVSVAQRNAELETDPDRRAEALLALADLYEVQLGNAPKAIEAYSTVLEIDEHNTDALNSLDRLYRLNMQWHELIEVLHRKSEAAADGEQIIALKAQIGQLYDEQIQDADRAIDAYKDILTIEPQHMPALKALESLYEKTGQTEDFLDVLEQQLDVSGSDDERVALYERMASVWEERGRLDRSAECLEKILLIDDRREETYVQLERLYQQDARHDDMVDVLRRHIDALSDPTERVQRYMQLGEVYEVHLRDLDQAIEAYSGVLSFDPDHTRALDALARLYEDTAAWEQAIDVMSRLSEIVDDAAYRVNMFYRLGRIFEEHLADEETAEIRYQQALELDAGAFDAMVQLIELYKRRGDWAKAATMMVRAEEHTQNQLEKSRLLYEAGNAYLNQLGDEASATDLFARTLKVDPDHAEAGEPLAEIYFREKRFAELEPVLDMLVRKVDRRDNRKLQDLYYKLAKTADALNNHEKALKYYRAAYDIDSTHLATLLGMADLLHRTQDWDRAFKMYQTILVHHRDSQKTEDVVDIFYKLGSIKIQLGERRKALNMFEKALELNRSHRLTLEAIVDLQSKQGDWDAVIQAKRAMLAAAEGEDAFQLHQELGDLYADKLNDIQRGIASYQAAHDLQPDNHPVLHRLIELYTVGEQWKKAVEVILRLTNLVDDAAIRAKFHYSAAVIYRDKIRALDEAIDCFNRVLDDDAKQLKAFEAIDRICTQKRDWKTLERAYRKMIKRLPAEGEDGLKVMLWHNLGEIYRTRIQDFDAAIAAFEVAAHLEPENVTRHEILSELYMIQMPKNAEYAEKAIAAHQTVIKTEPLKADSYKSYRALRKIYMETKQYDKAWCVCATLTFLRKADPEEQQFYEQYKQNRLLRARARLTDEIWSRYVFHPDLDRYICAILGTLAPSVGPMWAHSHRHFGLKRKERRDLSSDPALFSNVFNYVTQVLNVIQPELYLKQDHPIGLQMAHTEEIPSFVAGQQLLQGRSEKELAFAIGKQLTILRPELFLRNVLTAASQLRLVFLAGVRMVNPQFPLQPAEIPEIDKIIRHARGRMHAGQLEQLSGLVQRFASGKGEVDLTRWLTAVELTSNRVGLILCNDLEIAARILTNEPTGLGAMSPKDKILDLILYSVSEEYFKVRTHLGLGISQ
ncbi:MAG: tetratricopeptide repeat protein [Deltaproteobacteria bacterium]|nr:tetratricopeptide repeat protein [Deltaproteobacteria bacterium]